MLSREDLMNGTPPYLTLGNWRYGGIIKHCARFPCDKWRYPCLAPPRVARGAGALSHLGERAHAN